MEKTSLKSKSINAFFWDLSGSFANQGVGFIISIILARLLAPAEFGQIAMINVIFVFSNTLLNIGLGAALIQRKHLLPIHFSSVFYFNLLVGLILTVVTYLSAGIIANFYHQPILASLIKVISVIFIINSITIVQNIKLKKELNFRQINLFQVISNGLSGIVGIAMAYTNFGVWSLLTQIILNKIIYSGLTWAMVQWTPQWAFSMKALKQLWGFGFNMFITNFLNSIFTQFDILIIGRIFPVSTLGYYQRARSLDKMITQFSSSSIMQVLFPVFSSIQNEIERFRNIVIKSLLLLSFVTFFLIGILYLCSENVIVLLFTEKWLPSVGYFKILVLGSFIYPFSSLLVNIIVGRGNSKNNLKLALWKKLPLGINLIVGFMFGINGFLYGLLISGVISLFMNIHYSKEELNVDYMWFIKPIYPSLFLSFSLVLIISFLFDLLPEMHNFMALLIKGSVFTIAFVGVSYLFKLKSLQLVLTEIQLIKKKK